MQPFTSVFTGAASCVTLAAQIITLLNTAKANKSEFNSLLAAVHGIHYFLLELPTDGITSQGNRVLAQLHANLLGAHSLLQRVSGMGPLLSLIKAYSVRDEFLRVNKDIVNTFAILAAGEQLLVLAHNRIHQAEQAKQIRWHLQRAQSECFVQEEAALSKLRDVVAAAQHASFPEQLLQRRLLDQLQALPWLTELNPQQLLEEYRALQMMVLYNGDSWTGTQEQSRAEKDAVPDVGPGHVRRDQGSKKKGGMDEEMEEFLVQQLCAALAATVASSSPESLNPLQPPSDFLCPISGGLMVQPVLLVETGHSYEAAHIRRWLDSHNTCPISRKQLASKQLVVNYNLKKAVASWAADHGISLPPAPVYHSLHESCTSGSLQQQQQQQQQQEQDQQQQQDQMNQPQQQQQHIPGGLRSKDTSQAGSVVINQMPDPKALSSGLDLSNISIKDYSRNNTSCTRTRWAIGLTLLLLLATAGIGAGVGVFLSNRGRKGADAGRIAQTAAIQPTQPSASTTAPPNGITIPYNMQCGGKSAEGSGGWVGCGPAGRECWDAPWSGVHCLPNHVCTRDDDSSTPGSGEWWWSCQPGSSSAAGGAVGKPVEPQTPAQPTGICGSHTMKQGDTFWLLSQQRGVTLAAIQAVNPGIVPEQLQLGQRINLPCVESMASP